MGFTFSFCELSNACLYLKSTKICIKFHIKFNTAKVTKLQKCPFFSSHLQCQPQSQQTQHLFMGSNNVHYIQYWQKYTLTHECELIPIPIHTCTYVHLCIYNKFEIHTSFKIISCLQSFQTVNVIGLEWPWLPQYPRIILYSPMGIYMCRLILHCIKNPLTVVHLFSASHVILIFNWIGLFLNVRATD